MCACVCKVAQSCLTLCDPMDCSLPGSSVHGIQHTGMGSCSLFSGIFPTKISNPGLLHCRQILYHLSYQGSPLSIRYTNIVYIYQYINFHCYFLNIRKHPFLKCCVIVPCLDFRYYSHFCCSVTESYPTLYNHMNCSISSFPALHCLPNFAQTYVHWVSDAIQPSHPLSPSSPPALNLSQHTNLIK